MERKRLDIVLQRFQFADVCRREQVRPRRENLTELYVGGPELNQPLAKGARGGFRVALTVGANLLILLRQPRQSLIAGKVGEAVAREEADGSCQPRQVAWCKHRYCLLPAFSRRGSANSCSRHPNGRVR